MAYVSRTFHEDSILVLSSPLFLLTSNISIACQSPAPVAYAHNHLRLRIHCMDSSHILVPLLWSEPIHYPFILLYYKFFLNAINSSPLLKMGVPYHFFSHPSSKVPSLRFLSSSSIRAASIIFLTSMGLKLRGICFMS